MLFVLWSLSTAAAAVYFAAADFAAAAAAMTQTSTRIMHDSCLSNAAATEPVGNAFNLMKRVQKHPMHERKAKEKESLPVHASSQPSMHPDTCFQEHTRTAPAPQTCPLQTPLGTQPHQAAS